MLAKLADLKSWLKITDSVDDALLTQLLTGVSERFAQACNRTLERASLTEYHDGGIGAVSLKAYPIESVTSVKEAWDGDFDAATALTENSDWKQDPATGLIHRVLGVFLSGINSVQVVYTGGYLPPDQTPSGEQVAVPNDIQQAVIEQCRFAWQRRDELGLRSIGVGGGTWSLVMDKEWLPTVKAVILKYRRY